MNEGQVKKILKLEEGTEPKIVDREAENKTLETENVIGLVQSSQIGFLIALPISLGALFGWWLDGKFNTQPRLMLSFLFIGIFIGFTNLYLVIKQYSKKDKK